MLGSYRYTNQSSSIKPITQDLQEQEASKIESSKESTLLSIGFWVNKSKIVMKLKSRVM